MEFVLIMNVKYRNICILRRAKSGNWKKSKFQFSAFGKKLILLRANSGNRQTSTFYKVHSVKYGFCLNNSQMSIFCVV